ncbi:MAG: leucine-rich repeat domain-containing protein [Salinivirgaceae bacterium]|nr:leucine-rich repeat domain-containing protein [Salinivirgaceae bacterium]
MTDYVFSTNNVHIIQEPKVVVKYNYSFGNLWSWSKVSPLYFSQHGTTSDTVKLIGAWSIADLELMKAGFSNYTTSDNTLIKFDMSEAYFIDNEIDVFNNFFGRFTNLETVIWPSVQVNNKIDLKKAFYECNNLMHIENLKNLNNITNLGYAFYQCYKLESIAFSDSINNNPIDFGNTFEECNNLRKVINFENFVDVKNWSYTFSFCNKIDTIHISSDPNKAIYTYGTFDNCYKTIKMMPIGVTELPDNWKIYSNFVMPFDSIVIAENVGIEVNGGIIDSPQLIIYPTNVIATDYVFQLSNDGFETYTTHNIADSLTGNYIGYSLRLGGKNARMNDYVYSNNIVKLEPQTIYTAYFGNSVVEYTNKDIRPSLFENADSVTITGKLTQTQIDNLNNYTFTYYRENDNGSIEYQYNNQTQKLNLSKAYFDNVTKWKSLYLGSLSVLVLPDTIYDQPIDFDIHGTLLNPSIKRIENMEKLTNLVSLKYIFSNCWQLEEIHLGVDPNKYDSLSLVNAFTDCNAIKYMPDSVVSIPTVWHKFNNFVLPIDNVTLSGPIEFFADRCIALPSADSITYSPSYVCASDFLWQISNDGFNNNIITCNTDSFSKIDTNLLVDYKLRVGFKNKHTTEFAFSNAVNLTPIANMVIVYSDNSAKIYKPSNLPAYQIKDQTDSIIMYGTWTNADIQHLGNSMSSQRDNWHYNGIGDNRLMKVDMSQITFSDTLINMNGLFGYCWNLRELILPEKEVSINVSAYQLLTGDGKLHTLKNFENLTNITDFGLTFSNCSSLKEVHLGSDPNKLSSPELMYTFYDAESIIKYLPQGVTTIPKAWQEVIGIHKPQNFVIPIESVKSYISVNNDFLPYSGDVEYKSSATNLKLNSIFPTPSYAYVTDTIYVISYNDFATSDTISSLDGLLSSVEQPNFKLRIGLRNPISDFVYSEHSFIKNTDAVTETSASNVWVRPNPAKDYITIGTNSSNSIVSIYNILTRVRYKQISKSVK